MKELNYNYSQGTIKKSFVDSSDLIAPINGKENCVEVKEKNNPLLIKPEEKAELILWDWLKTLGLNVNEVYFNRINKLNAPKFKVKGKIKEIPDLLVSINGLKGEEFIVIEVKDNKKSMNVQGSQKILRYYENYFLNNTFYFIDNKKVQVDYFLTATNDSPNGFLFKDEELGFFQDNKKDHSQLLKYSMFPRYEYQRTHDFMRSLTSNFKELRKKINIKNKAPAIGILISNPRIDSFPYMQIIKYTNSWRQKFWRI